MITYWGLKTEFEEQKRMREVCQSILATLPEENLICKRQGDKYHMYLSLKKDGRCCQKSISQRGEGKALIDLLKYKKRFVLLFNGICQRRKSAQHSKSTCNCLATRTAVTSAFSFSVLFIAYCAAIRENA